jgi:outer membrane protein assembly factor BamB
MKIKLCMLIVLTGFLSLSWGCASKQADQTQPQPAAQTEQTEQAKSSNPGLIGGTFNLLRDTVSLIPFVDLKKANDAADPEQTPGFRNDFPIAASDLQRTGLKVHWASNLDVPVTEKITQWNILDNKYLITVESPSNLFTLVNLSDGRILWREIQGQMTDRFYQPFLFGETICVNSETHMIKIDVRTGRANEIVALKAVVNNPPAHVVNFAIFGGLNGRIFAHDLNTGYPKWNYQLQAGITAPPIASSSAVLVGDAGGVYILLNPKNGEPIWKGRTFRQISAPGVVLNDKNLVLIPSEDQTLYALESIFGGDVWRYHAKRALTHQPIVFDEMVLLPITNDGLYALDVNTGKVLWNTNEHLKPFDSSKDNLYCFKTNSLWVLDKETGKTVSQIPTADITDMIALSNKQFLVVTQSGRLLKLQR